MPLARFQMFMIIPPSTLLIVVDLSTQKIYALLTLICQVFCAFFIQLYVIHLTSECDQYVPTQRSLNDTKQQVEYFRQLN